MKTILCAVMATIGFFFVTNGFLEASSSFRLVSGGFGVSHSPIWAAYHQNIFKKHGLNVEYLAIESGSTATQVLMAGEVQTLFSTGSVAVGANLEGADLAIITGGINFLHFKVIVRPEIKQPEDLKGKAVGISRFGSATELAMQVALEKLGVNLKQVTMIQAGGNTNRIAGLKGGAIYAALLSEPHATIATKTLGMKSLFNLGDIATPFPLNCFIIKRSYLNSNRANVVNFVKSVIEGLFTVLKDKALAVRLIKKYMRVDDEKAGIGYDVYVNEQGYGLLNLPDRRGLEFAISLVAQLNPKASGQTPESLRLLEPSVLDEIKKSGFVEKVKGNW
ncbi:MAG: ABC transporter substrate-binding protein [Deltaproteobacteria bacterium]|nr:ABC transporter substrate-binding protein [Deltaproteobacteria bacterium]